MNFDGYWMQLAGYALALLMVIVLLGRTVRETFAQSWLAVGLAVSSLLAPMFGLAMASGTELGSWALAGLSLGTIGALLRESERRRPVGTWFSHRITSPDQVFVFRFGRDRYVEWMISGLFFILLPMLVVAFGSHFGFTASELSADALARGSDWDNGLIWIAIVVVTAAWIDRGDRALAGGRLLALLAIEGALRLVLLGWALAMSDFDVFRWGFRGPEVQGRLQLELILSFGIGIVVLAFVAAPLTIGMQQVAAIAQLKGRNWSTVLRLGCLVLVVLAVALEWATGQIDWSRAAMDAQGNLLSTLVRASFFFSTSVVMVISLTQQLHRQLSGSEAGADDVPHKRHSIGAYAASTSCLLLAKLLFDLDDNRELSEMWLIAMSGVAQLFPALLGSLFWPGARRDAASASLRAGLGLWAVLILVPALLGNVGLFQNRELADMISGDSPEPRLPALVGLACVILLVNSLVFFWKSLSRPSAERASAKPGAPADWLAEQRTVWECYSLLETLLGTRRAMEVLDRGGAAELAMDARAPDELLLTVAIEIRLVLGDPESAQILEGKLGNRDLAIGEVASMLQTVSASGNQRTARILDKMPTPVLVTSDDGHRLFCNEAASVLFGAADSPADPVQPTAESQLMHWAEQLGADSAQQHKNAERLRQWLLSDGDQPLALTGRSGEHFELLRDRVADVGWLWTVLDVSRHKQAELDLRDTAGTLEQRVHERTRALLAASESAEKARLSKTRFFAAASHDLLQPLNAARIFASSLADQPELSLATRQIAARIDTALRNAEDVIDVLVDVAKLDTGNVRAVIEDIDLGDLLRGLLDQFAAIAEARKLSLRLGPCSVVARTDRRLLRRVLQNLISNALRYTSRGGVLVGVRRGPRGWIRIEVIDTGPGISAELQQVVFDEFQRVGTGSPWGEKGLGLGLSICKSICSLLGHELSLKSSRGRGARFSVTMRLSAARSATSVTPHTTPPASAVAAKGLGLNVLCVDDESDVLDAMTGLVSAWGCKVVRASGFSAAIAAATLRAPDVAMVDFQFDNDQGVNGLDIIKALRELHPSHRLLAVLITANRTNETLALAAKLEIPVLQKPLRAARLRALIEAYVRG